MHSRRRVQLYGLCDFLGGLHADCFDDESNYGFNRATMMRMRAVAGAVSSPFARSALEISREIERRSGEEIRRGDETWCPDRIISPEPRRVDEGRGPDARDRHHTRHQRIVRSLASPCCSLVCVL